MAPPVGTNIYGSTLRISRGPLALWEFNNGSGFGIYLYENDNWQADDDWLLWKFKREGREARELFDLLVDKLGSSLRD